MSLGLLVILSIIALFWAISLSRRIRELTLWIEDLNHKVSRLTSKVERLGAGEDREESAPAQPVAARPPVDIQLSEETPEEIIFEEPLAPMPEAGAFERSQYAEVPGLTEKEPEDDLAATPTEHAFRPETPPEPEEAKLGFEARLGGTWALRIGLFLLAIGIAYFARLIAPRIGPGAKVAIAYAGCLGLFAVGKVFERKLQNFARPVMAGALALAFFVSFTSHFISPMRCLPLAAALAWMLAGVFAILFTAERWKSQPTAGLAIFLGHVSAFVAAGEADAFSLIVIAFLSAMAVALFLRHDWLPLSIFAVVVAYPTHVLWITVEHVQTTPQRAFWINLIFLSSYYLIFQVSDLIWWRRKCSKTEDTFSPSQVLTARILGPTNLVCYVAIVSFIYVGTKVYLPDIHWFFFALAAFQGTLTLAHRSYGNRDYVLYPAVGVILMTMGFFSAFEGLTLNLVLASEALVLLIAAHRTRVWVFHLLAQVMLAINFVHYWVYMRGAEATLTYFIGGLMTAAVYFVKSSFEEIWYGGDGVHEWEESGTHGSISRALAERFSVVYSPIAPYLAHAHAAGGAVILASQCARFFTDSNAAMILSFLVLGLAVIALLRRSIPFLVGHLFLQAAILLLMDRFLSGDTQITPLIEWWVVAAGLIACAIAVTAMQWRMTEPAKSTRGLFAEQLTILCTVGLAFACLFYGKESESLYLAWIAAIALLYFCQDRIETALKKIGEEAGALAGVFPMAETLTCIAGALLIIVATNTHVKNEISFPVWLILWSAVIVSVAGIRRSRYIYLSGFIVIIACYLTFLEKSFLIRVMDDTAASLFIILVTLAMAWGQDFLLRRTINRLSGRMLALAEVLTHIPYALGMFLLTAFLYHRVSFPWSLPAISVCCIGLYCCSGPIGMRRGALSSFAFILLAYCIGFVQYAQRLEMPRAFLVPIIAFFAIGLIFERILAVSKGLEYQVGFERAVKSGEELEFRKEWHNITPTARSAIVVAATAVIMMGIYHSSLLGVKWTTAGWSLIAALLIGLGFAWRSPGYRRTALAVFAICLVRVFIVDTRNLADTYRTLAFIILGLCFLVMGWLYTRFASDIRKWL